MANIHRLGDYNNNNQNNQYGRPQFGAQPRVNNAFQQQPLLGGAGGNVQYVNPRQETFFDMLKFTFCPTFTIFSFIFFITLIDVLVYITTIIASLAKYQAFDGSNFLGPKTQTLNTFGSNNPYRMQHDAQIWRFITPIFLHAGFMHIFSNMLSQMIIGFMLESVMGPFRVGLLYFVAGVGGNLFSALCAPDKLSVGASTSIFGLLASLLSLVLVNWKALDRSPEVRCCLIIFVIFLFLFSLLMAFSNQVGTVDVFGHLGGFISGFFFGTLIMIHMRGQEARRRGSYEKICQMVGGAGTLIYFVLCFSLFYTVVDTVFLI